MKIMVVEEGHGALFFVCQALEALGASVITAPSLDEDKVLVHKIDAVLHVWSAFTADVERVQVSNMREVDPNLVVVLFTRVEDVPSLRQEMKHALVADQRALEAALAARTAQAIVKEVRARRPGATAPGKTG